MKAIQFSLAKPLKNTKFWLLGIAVVLIAIHLNITWKSDNSNLWGISVIFLSTVCYLIWEKRNNFSLESGVISSFLGTLLIALILSKSTSFSENFPYVSPFISAVGLGLIASGFKGLKQYWQELLILFFLGVPKVTLLWLIDISPLTAKFAAFVLWYSGFEVSRQGLNITLPTGTVEVYPGCSGMEAIIHLCGLAVLFLVMVSTDWSKKIIVPGVAILIAFVVNGIRVALMAVLAAPSTQKAFEYWHKGDGSLIFSLISVSIFGLFCLFLLRQNEPSNQDSIL